uniref:Uncharacterized protein n=1 Tax=Anopheles culicifacies TaxID=139723 RepID=A0A182MHX7_9DIPT
MVLMRLFCFQLSVRLGSIIVGGCCMLETIITMIVLAALGGAPFLHQEALYYEENMHLYNPHDVFLWLITLCKTNAELFYTATMICMALYLPCCGIMMAGAYFVSVPLGIGRGRQGYHTPLNDTFVSAVDEAISHSTVRSGGACEIDLHHTDPRDRNDVLLFYLWGCVVALMQILRIVRSPEYIAVFGDNPLAPVDPGETTPPGTITNDHTTLEWNGTGLKPKQRNNLNKNLERLPPTALSTGQFNGPNMLIDDFRPLHSRYSYGWAI